MISRSVFGTASELADEIRSESKGSFNLIIIKPLPKASGLLGAKIELCQKDFIETLE